LGFERIALFACARSIIYTASLGGLALHFNFQAWRPKSWNRPSRKRIVLVFEGHAFIGMADATREQSRKVLDTVDSIRKSSCKYNFKTMQYGLVLQLYNYTLSVTLKYKVNPP